MMGDGSRSGLGRRQPYHRVVDPQSFPHEAAIAVSLPVLLFTVVTSLLTGVLFGIAGSLALNRVMVLWASGSSHDPVMLLGVFITLLLVGSIACTLPTPRAASIDQARALRQE